MLSSLPPELLALVIESTIPHTFHSTTYRDRQRTLCSLSLVSKTFRSIAQPLLLEIVWIKSAQHLDLLPTFNEQDRAAVQQGKRCWLVVGSEHDRNRDAEKERKLFEKAAKDFSSLRALTWARQSNDDEVDISLIDEFSRTLPVLLRFNSILILSPWLQSFEASSLPSLRPVHGVLHHSPTSDLSHSSEHHHL